MRSLALAALLVAVPLLLAASPVHAKEAPTALLTIDVLADRSERLVLAFEGLDTNTEYRSICLPARAELVSLRDGQGDLPHTADEKDGRVSLTFRPRTSGVTVEMTRAPATEGTAPLFHASANFCTTASSRVEVVARAEAPLQMYFASAPGVVEQGEARWLSTGPNYVTYAYEAPLDASAGLVAVDHAPFRLFAPAERAAEARELAAVAAPALNAALREAGLPLPWSPLRVHFSALGEYAWEAGHYGGDGVIVVKPSTLVPDPREGYPYVGAKVLVHEAFHAASAPTGKGEVNDTIAWWLEGTARRSERHVDDVLPDARRYCEQDGVQVQCWFFDDRIPRAQLDSAYEPGFTFERRWEPSIPQSEDTRRFYYAYSDYVVAAYIERAGEPAYRAVWDQVTAAFTRGEGCPCEDGWLEGLLVDAAGNLTADEIYRPWADLRARDPAAFDARVAPLVQGEQKVDAPPLFGLPVPAPAAWALVAAIVGVALVARRARG